jgi:hypothetical protein
MSEDYYLKGKRYRDKIYEYRVPIYYFMLEFFQHNNIKLLKHSPIFHDFYIANRLNQIYCSKKCKRIKNWPPEKWNKYIQADREKKKREKQKNQEAEREKEIQNRMSSQELTREEAIDQIDFDGNL